MICQGKLKQEHRDQKWTNKVNSPYEIIKTQDLIVPGKQKTKKYSAKIGKNTKG